MAENTINDFNTLPEQVQINKEDIKKLSDSSNAQTEQLQTLSTKVDTNTSNIANLGWELKTNANGDKNYIPKNFDENIPYSLTNITDSTQASGLNTYKDSDGYVWSYLSIYIPSEDDFVGIWTGHNNTDGYFCSLSMATPNDKTTYLVVTYIANSDCPQSLNNDTYKEDMTIATMGWVNKYYPTKTELSNANKRIDALDTGTFDADLTAAGLAKIQANVTLGISITLKKNIDFVEAAFDVDAYKTILFSLYTDQSEDYYISSNIKLDVGYTANVYIDNDQPSIWLTGIGVIKLGPALETDNNYLCFIAYDTAYNSGIIINPIIKLN